MSYELTGTLHTKSETVQRTEKFKVREFVVEQKEDVNGKTFTNFIKLQAAQDKTSLLDDVKVGNHVKVKFNLRGSKHEKDGKVSYYTNLDAWSIEVSGKQEKLIEEAEVIDDGSDLPF